MLRNKKSLIVVSLLLVISLVAVGCGGDQTAAAPEDRDTLVVGQGADATTLDPHGGNEQPASRVMKQIYETLVEQDNNMELQPGLAESWEQVDELTFEFKLKEGVKFHNGEELTANDVAFTFRRASDSAHVGHIIGVIDPEGIEVVDDYTIRIATEEPFAPLLAHLAHTNAGILNEKAVMETGEDFGQNPVGTGPFMFSKWNHGDSIELVKFDDYHNEEKMGKVEKIVFRSISESVNRTIELETGGIDIAYDIPPTDLDRIDSADDLILLRQENLTSSYIGFNVNKEPFDDVRVRQAINYVLDMDLIIEAVYEGVGTPSNGPLGPNVWGSNQNLEPYGYNLEKAQALMAEAGYADGFSTTIWTNDDQGRMDTAEIVQNQLGALNIDARVNVMEWGAYLDGTSSGEHDMFILSWGTVTGDPDYGLYPLFHSSSHGDGGNRTFFSNARVDELLDAARVSADPDVRLAAYLEVQEIVRDEAPWIFVLSGETTSGTRSYVRGFEQHPAGHHALWNVYFE